MPYFDAGKSRHYYEEYGSGPPVILAHGVGGNHASWFNQIPTLEKTYRTITVDQRAFGNSEDVEGIGASGYVEDMKALFDHLEIDRAVVVGQSMGGGTLAGFTCRYPEHVRAFVMCDSSAGLAPPEDMADAIARVHEATWGLSQAERVLGPNVRNNDPERTLLYLQIASFNSVTVRTLKGKLPKWTPAELSKSNVPILFIVGEDDVLVPPAIVRQIHERVPGSRFVQIDGSGHSAYFEDPETFNPILLDFLAEVHAG